jgi:hypothetical protein
LTASSVVCMMMPSFACVETRSVSKMNWCGSIYSHFWPLVCHWRPWTLGPQACSHIICSDDFILDAVAKTLVNFSCWIFCW